MIIHAKTPVRAALKSHQDMLKGSRLFQSLLTRLRYEGKPRLGINLRQADRTFAFLHQVLQQFSIEETVIFPYWVRHIPRLEPAVRMLQAEQDEFQAGFKKFERSFRRVEKPKPDGRACNELWENGMYLFYLLNHYLRAEKRIYETGFKKLRPDEKKELKKRIQEAS